MRERTRRNEDEGREWRGRRMKKRMIRKEGK